MQVRTLLAGSAMLAFLAGCAAGPADDRADMAMDDAEVVYQGTLPCRNCAGIDLNVTLRGDEQAALEERTFELRASYQEHPQEPPDEEYAGNWEVLSGTAVDPDATVYELTPDGEGQVYYFLRVDEQTLELIDPQRRRFQNNEALQLQRR
ncbi:copper resistance protein [Halomonas sp. MCCC 1A17488]|uniref:Copper resistance protein n=1 Tax=Billgrantia sulfidoxydans TaxID=2733484 RepID=A0ABX7WAT7_9GAMM|nr:MULTISPECIES: copper resistance protein NlpE N-terminal domain-containing protein [Halomonas]MCE8018315.1 copper resistance protein [Halomonas sp. MCCC 1A17488]MCG3241648.1 copper resistance protein [Halomonas sp. MCCC 1A17488]QPP49320.1 copper resistance protein NlpE N-terminal domain-containing protein [Halomonas sp. SS10-MC5]QTP56677.1 copper resistance protein [Halomonas sulfidoxydans]